MKLNDIKDLTTNHKVKILINYFWDRSDYWEALSSQEFNDIYDVGHTIIQIFCKKYEKLISTTNNVIKITSVHTNKIRASIISERSDLCNLCELIYGEALYWHYKSKICDSYEQIYHFDLQVGKM